MSLDSISKKETDKRFVHFEMFYEKDNQRGECLKKNTNLAEEIKKQPKKKAISKKVLSESLLYKKKKEKRTCWDLKCRKENK